MRRWLLVATGVHALLVASARLAFREVPRPAPPVLAAQEFSVEYELDARPDVPPTSEAVPTTDRVADAERPRARASEPAAPAPLENTVPEGEGADAAAIVEAAPEAPSEATPNAAGEVDLGIGADAWRRWAALGREATPGAPAAERRAGAYETPGAPKQSNTGGLQEGLEARDRKLGLGPRGRVISAFHRAARAYEAPELGTASFNVTVLKTGEVEISVGANSGETDKWRAVAARAAADLKKSPPRIPASRAGVRMVIDLVAEETYPNGLNPKDLHGPKLEARAPQIKSTEETKKELEADNPLAGKNPNDPIPQFPLAFELPGVYLSQRGKVCGYNLGVTPLGVTLQGGCDPSNVGVKPQRIVRAKVRDEMMF